MNINKSNRKIQIFSGIFLLCITLSFLAYYFIFNIYEVTIKTEPKFLFADQNSTIRVEAVPVNALGWQVPFRKAESKFEIIEGSDLVVIEQLSEKDGLLTLRSKGRHGIVGIVITSNYALLPMYIEIKILPTTAQLFLL